MDASMSYETLIAAAGSVVIEPRGISMLPFLKEGRDSVRLVSPTAAPRKYDIVLYRVRDEYVLHRIIGFDGDNYIICGDNCRGWERGHGRGDIIAVVDEIYRNGTGPKTALSQKSNLRAPLVLVITKKNCYEIEKK